jgi:hypothetical protein
MQKLILQYVTIMAIGLVTVMAARAADTMIANGTFQGKNGHVASGGVSVVKTADGIVVLLRDDFSFDGAPDPKLGFGKGGYIKSTQFSALKSNNGGQRYSIPSRIDTAAYTEIWIWCQRYAVPLGRAVLKTSKN